MKKIIFLFAATMLAGSVMSQQAPPPQKKKVTPSQQQTEEKTTVLMRNDTVWLRKGAQETVLEEEIKMGEATVNPRGRVTLKSGLVINLKEGDVLLDNGKILTAPEKK